MGCVLINNVGLAVLPFSFFSINKKYILKCTVQRLQLLVCVLWHRSVFYFTSPHKGTFCDSSGHLNTFEGLHLQPPLAVCAPFCSCLCLQNRTPYSSVSRNHRKRKSPFPPCADQSSYKKCSNEEKAVLLPDPCLGPPW